MYAIANLLDTVITLYIWCLFIYIVLGWLLHFGVVNSGNRLVYRVMEVLYRLIEPVLQPIRRFIPAFGGIDISPIILVLILVFVRDFFIVDLKLRHSG